MKFFFPLFQSFVWIVSGCLMGGEKKKAEKSRFDNNYALIKFLPNCIIININSIQKEEV